MFHVSGLIFAILLWPNGAPGAKGDRPDDKPKMTAYLVEPAKANGTAIVILPGGGYGMLAVNHEGHDMAKWFNSLGISAFVVEYRHRGKGYGHPAPLQDAQRAIRTVRARAAEWKINPDRIGIIGSSAGGHLASTTGTHFDKGNPKSDDPIERASCRPDFMILCYPVIAFDEPYTHRGSQTNLLGKDADPALVRSLSNEKQVTKETPPTFIFHTTDDSGVPVENAIYFFLAARKAGVPIELHSYEHGPHGVGMAPTNPILSTWTKCCENWLRGRGLLGK